MDSVFSRDRLDRHGTCSCAGLPDFAYDLAILLHWLVGVRGFGLSVASVHVLVFLQVRRQFKSKLQLVGQELDLRNVGSLDEGIVQTRPVRLDCFRFG